ncbi:MAG: glycosyltransferase family 2 protein [Leptospirales bacterium]
MSFAKKISGCIITLNEEKTIGDALDSLDFCDEIVIVDSNSTDRTHAIIKGFSNKFKTAKGANKGPVIKVIQQKFLGYGPQKNFATSKCSFEWVLSIDSDERVSPQLHDSIQKWRNSEDDAEIGAYVTNRRNFYIDRWVYHSGWYPDRRIRFFRKGWGQWADVQVHELYEQSKGKTGYLKGDLLHYSIMSLDAHIDNTNRFTTAAAQEAFARGKNSGIVGIIFRAFFTFIKMYFVKLGFLDGKSGFILAIMSSYYSFAKYTKLWYLCRQKEKNGN